RVRLRVRQGERAAPGPAEHLPGGDAEVLAEQLDVGHEMPGGVEPHVDVGVAGVRCTATASALVEEDDPVHLRIEELPVPCRGAAAGPAVQELDGLAVGVSAMLPVDAVSIAVEQVARLVRLDRRIQSVHFHVSLPRMPVIQGPFTVTRFRYTRRSATPGRASLTQ